MADYVVWPENESQSPFTNRKIPVPHLDLIGLLDTPISRKAMNGSCSRSGKSPI